MASGCRAAGFAGAVSFWWRRVARIWPLHVCLLAGFLLLVAVLAITGRDISAYPLAELPLHVLLIQNWGFTPALSWNDPAWSISCEMGAYMAFPLVVALCRWDRLAGWALVALGIGVLVAIWQFFALFDSKSLGVMIATHGLARCLREFALGNILCLLWLRWREVPSAALRSAMTCAAALEAGVLGNLPETMYVPLCFASLIMALALDGGPVSRFLGGRMLTYLGEISYSTYLSHVLLFILFKLAFVDSSQLVSLPKLAAFMALVAGASAVLYHGVEKPAQRWLNGWAPGQPGRAQTA